MLGVFDSGAGGIAVTRELRLLCPRADIVLFRDRPGAPYGTKSRPELMKLVTHDIEALIDRGATKILMACCTASTLHRELDSALREVSIPIIEPTARAAAKLTKNGRIGVIATNTTVNSGAFSKALAEIDPSLPVMQWQAQSLVSLVEGGARDGLLSDEDIQKVRDALSGVMRSDIDTLILGCTHFPLIEGTISQLLPGIKTVSSAKEGARAVLPCQMGTGKTIYIENKPKR